MLAEVTREIEEFVAAAGWDQPVQLFALVPTATLLEAEPSMAGQLDEAAPLTPIAQEPLAEPELDVALAGIAWPDVVQGCAIVQEIVVLPTEAEAALADSGDGSPDVLARLAAEHPARREARLVAAVLRGDDDTAGPRACVLRLRAVGDEVDEIVEHPDLATNLVEALRRTLQPED